MLTSSTLKLSPKYIDFLNDTTSTWDNLEGTTAAGKTTVGIMKFMMKVAASKESLHIIAGANLGIVQKNIVHAQLGIMDVFGNMIDEKSHGSSMHGSAHLVFHTPNGDKYIFLLGYEDQSRWKNVLGGQYGCIYIDEINTADMAFVVEASIRNKYMMTTLNPDDPKLEVYDKFINRSRPLPKYSSSVPNEIMKDLNKVTAMPQWRYWFFDFYDNAGLTEDRRNQIINSAPKGTKLHRNKILGLRGRSEGLVFQSFSDVNVISRAEADRRRYTQYTIGVDTSYSQKSDDTISFIFAGISTLGEYIVLDEFVQNNRDRDEPLAPSDVAKKLVEFAERNRERYGFSRFVYVDNADQSTITELNKLKRKLSLSYNFINSDKRVKIIDRINSMNGWIGGTAQTENVYYRVVDECSNHIDELEVYAWKGDMPEDGNDHTINASQYAWIPHRSIIGVNVGPKDDTPTSPSINALRQRLKI